MTAKHIPAHAQYSPDYLQGYRDGFVSRADIRDNFKFQIMGVDLETLFKLIEDYLLKQNQSETEFIPVGYEFNWNDRHKINAWFKEVKGQGFKIVKDIE